MNVKMYNQRLTEPTVFVTKGRQWVKQYDNFIVYLNNGEEFEIELFNPTNNKVLAKIKLNGASLGSGVVLRPGERVFLERYFDEAKKFLFETYEVEAGNENIQRAIKLNGEVEVKFYAEHHNIWCNYNPGYWTYTTGPDITIGNTTDTVRGIAYGSTVNCCYSSSEISAQPQMEETGRVEKGSESNQEFNYDGISFNTYYSWHRTWTIKPLSKKPYVAEDLSIYCTECGTKRKKTTHKFCPECGNKF